MSSRIHLQKTLQQRGYYIFLLLYVGALVSHILWAETMPLISLLSKLILVLIFFLIAWFEPEDGVCLFLISAIIFGVNGKFHFIVGKYSFSILFLCILLGLTIKSKGQRQYLLARLRESTLALPLILVSFILPLIGLLGGYLQGNEFRFIVKDADGGIFYLLYFCMLGLIGSESSLTKVLKSFAYSIIVAAGCLCFLGFAIPFLKLGPAFIVSLLYETLNLGGHLERVSIFFMRIYTGNGLFLTYAFSFCVLMFLTRKRLAVFLWFLLSSMISLTLLVSYTRGYWLAAGISLVFLFGSLPGRLKLKSIAYGLVLLGLVLIVSVPSYFSLFQRMFYEANQIYQSLFYFTRIQEMLVATPGWGVYKTVDAGDHWFALNEGLLDHDVRAFEIDPYNSLRMYAGTTAGGVFVTSNGGRTWLDKNAGLIQLNARALLIDQSDSRTVYAGTYGNGVFKTTNYGDLWFTASQGMDRCDVIGLGWDPDVSHIIYAGIANGALYSSDDGAESWTPVPRTLLDIGTRLLLNDHRVKSIYIGFWNEKIYRIKGRSTLLKIKQYRTLLTQAWKQPIFGYGFGATLPGNVTYRSTNDPNPHIFEASYADLLFKVGLVGSLIWGFLVVMILYHYFKFNREGPVSSKLLLACFVCPMIGNLFAYATNPYIYSSFGIISLVITAFVADHVLYLRKVKGISPGWHLFTLPVDKGSPPKNFL